MTVLFNKSIVGYDVYKERPDGLNEYLGFCDSHTRTAIKAVALKLIPSTHMYELRQTTTGFEYATTIGVYLKFERVRRRIETVNNDAQEFVKGKSAKCL